MKFSDEIGETLSPASEVLPSASEDRGPPMVQLAGWNSPSRVKGNTGFTLVELLVVLAIISMLVGLFLPVLGAAMAEGKSAQCISNLRQMGIAAQTYAVHHEGEYPPAYVLDYRDGIKYEWDVTMVNNEPHPGLLWEGDGDARVQQCPSFSGEGNTDSPFTGYNYNASFIGGYKLIKANGEIAREVKSATLDLIQNPSQCAVFGDGEYYSGANKFMRSPLPGDLDIDGSTRTGGTQGFRHNHRTNVAFADGHVASFSEAFSDAGANPNTAAYGFLSPDNRLYDLD